MIEELLRPLVPQKFLTNHKFRTWHLNVLNPLPQRCVMGLRMSDIRSVVKKIIKEDRGKLFIGHFRQAYINDQFSLTYEEQVIWGLLINAQKCEISEKLQMFKDFIPAIDSWSVCDTVCCDAKWMAHVDGEVAWQFLLPYFKSEEEFHVRFAVVMSMCYFLREEWLDSVFSQIESITYSVIHSEYHHPLSAYYVKMAVAWLLATALAKYPDRTREFVQKATLPNDVVKLYIRKARESFRTRHISAV